MLNAKKASTEPMLKGWKDLGDFLGFGATGAALGQKRNARCARGAVQEGIRPIAWMRRSVEVNVRVIQ
jgi:hypothetical protein